MSAAKFQFSNAVVVEGSLVGVINAIREYDECQIKHFVYDKVLEDYE